MINLYLSNSKNELTRDNLIEYVKCKYKNDIRIYEEKLSYWESEEIQAHVDKQLANNKQVEITEAEQPRKKRIIVVKKKQ